MKKIALVCLDNLGDTIMATSLLRPLKVHFPQAKIGLWVKQYTAGLFDDRTWVSTVHASDPFWDTSPGLQKGNWAFFHQTLREIKAEGYDAALILNAEWRRTLACLWAGIPKRIGYNRRKSGFFLTDKFEPVEPKRHPVDEHRSLLESWLSRSFDDAISLPILALSASEKTNASELISKLGWSNNRRLTIHPATGDDLKCWPLQKWAALIQKLYESNQNRRFFIVCSPAETSLIAPAFQSLPPSIFHLVASTTSVLKSVLSETHLLIGGDSGPGHMACALGKPVISLFGPTDPALYAARGAGSVTVIKKMPLRDLDVAEVGSAAEQALNRV